MPSPSELHAFEAAGEHGHVVFTNGSDRALVARKFREATEDILASTTSFKMERLGWTDHDGVRVAKVVKYMTNIKELNFFFNPSLGDEGLATLMLACEQPGVLPNLEVLGCDTSSPNVGDATVAALAHALQNGAFPKLKILWARDAAKAPGTKLETKVALKNAGNARVPPVNVILE